MVLFYLVSYKDYLGKKIKGVGGGGITSTSTPSESTQAANIFSGLSKQRHIFSFYNIRLL